jgi:hypothetical protein
MCQECTELGQFAQALLDVLGLPKCEAICHEPECEWKETCATRDVAKCAATWHVYENHKDTWAKIVGDRPPRDPDPRTEEGMAAIMMGTLLYGPMTD